MIVQKKGADKKEQSSSSSMMVGNREGQEVEDEPYNLIRGATSLMVTEDVDVSDESDEMMTMRKNL